MVHKDPRQDIVDNINLKSSKVLLKSSTILLCGGRCNQNYSGPPYISVRDGLMHSRPSREVHDYQLLCAESHPQWINDGLFPDLILYENLLASFSSLLVVILETPSAIAEVGVFSQHEELSRKSMIVIPTEYHNSDSFIDLGVLRQVESSTRWVSSHYYDWRESDSATITQELIDDVKVDVEELVNGMPQTEFFVATREGHKLVLVSKLLSIFLAVKEKELLGYLHALEIDISAQALRRYLTLLENLEIIRSIAQGNTTFYTANDDLPYEMRLAFSDRATDTVKVEDMCRDYYQAAPSEKKRVKAIAAAFGN